MRLSSIAFGTGLKEPAMAPRVGFMTRAAWGRVREGAFIWHDDTVCEVMSISRDEVQLRSYVNVATGISTRDKRLGFCAGEEGSISVDAQLFLVDDVVVREDGRLLITADEIRVVRAAASRFTDESESSGSESERDTFNMDTQHVAVTDYSCITQAHETLPWESHYGNLTSRSAHAWVAADVATNLQVKAAMEKATELQSEEGFEPHRKILAYSDGARFSPTEQRGRRRR